VVVKEIKELKRKLENALDENTRLREERAGCGREKCTGNQRDAGTGTVRPDIAFHRRLEHRYKILMAYATAYA